MTQTVLPHLVIPGTPRPVTARARRRAWSESGVQVWWKLALVVVLVAGFVGYQYAGQALKQRRLATEGVLVTGKAVRVQGVSEKENLSFSVPRDQTIPIEFQVVLPDGRLATLAGYLPPAPGRVRVNQDVKLRVDPNDLTHWAEVNDILPWSRVLAIPLFMMLPVAAILLAIAYWRRGRVLKVWADGMRGDAVVVDLRQSATAPLSRVVRFTLADGIDKRVFTTLFPSRSGIPGKGATFPIIYPFDEPQHAIAAELYLGGETPDRTGVT